MALTYLSYALSKLCYTGHECYNLHKYVTYWKVWLPCLVFKVMLTLPPFFEWHIFKMYIQEISHQDIYSSL